VIWCLVVSVVVCIIYSFKVSSVLCNSMAWPAKIYIYWVCPLFCLICDTKPCGALIFYHNKLSYLTSSWPKNYFWIFGRAVAVYSFAGSLAPIWAVTEWLHLIHFLVEFLWCCSVNCINVSVNKKGGKRKLAQLNPAQRTKIKSSQFSWVMQTWRYFLWNTCGLWAQV
jgi:hypothetical protein